MKKRIISMALAGLLALTLCVPAFANEGDLFENSWDVALFLQDAACVTVESSAELTGAVSGAIEANVDLEMEKTAVAYQDGDALTMVSYEASDPVAMMEGTGVFAPNGSVYFLSGGSDSRKRAIVKYDSVAEGTFSDLSQLSLYFAALGDNKVNAAETSADGDRCLAYETTVAEIKELLDICIPEMLKGYDEAALADAGAQVQVQFDLWTDEYEADVTVVCPRLGEALLKQLDGVESVANAGLTIEIEIVGLTAENADYGEYRVTDEIMAQFESELGSQMTEQAGEAPACGTLKDFLWAVYEPGYAETADRESAKDALRAALSGDQAGEEAPAEAPAE